jgi:hypothetical protein
MKIKVIKIIFEHQRALQVLNEALFVSQNKIIFLRLFVILILNWRSNPF